MHPRSLVGGTEQRSSVVRQDHSEDLLATPKVRLHVIGMRLAVMVRAKECERPEYAKVHGASKLGVLLRLHLASLLAVLT